MSRKDLVRLMHEFKTELNWVLATMTANRVTRVGWAWGPGLMAKRWAMRNGPEYEQILDDAMIQLKSGKNLDGTLFLVHKLLMDRFHDGSKKKPHHSQHENYTKMLRGMQAILLGEELRTIKPPTKPADLFTWFMNERPSQLGRRIKLLMPLQKGEIDGDE
jgi:hypothetical protein